MLVKENNLNDTSAEKKSVEYASFLIIPLECNQSMKEVASNLTNHNIKEFDIISEDFNDIFKSMLNDQTINTVSTCFKFHGNQIIDSESNITELTYSKNNNKYTFQFTDSYIYLFHTNVAFLCIGLLYNDIAGISALCNLGRNDCESIIIQTGKNNTNIELNSKICDFIAKFNLQLFFPKSPAMLEKYIYTLALCDKWFSSVEELKHKTFKLHQMLPFESNVSDTSEEDIKYVYSVKDATYNEHRWGCCIASQIFTHLFAKAKKEELQNSDTNENSYRRKHTCIADVILTESQDTLPIIIFALYERYTCLNFVHKLKHCFTDKKELKKLTNYMLAFKSYGTFPSTDLSRYHNIKQIYKNLATVFDIEKSLKDVEIKLDLLMDHQQEKIESKNSKLINFITVLGIISIIEAIQSILQTLMSGEKYAYLITLIPLVFTAVFFIMLLLVLKFEKND